MHEVHLHQLQSNHPVWLVYSLINQRKLFQYLVEIKNLILKVISLF